MRKSSVDANVTSTERPKDQTRHNAAFAAIRQDKTAPVSRGCSDVEVTPARLLHANRFQGTRFPNPHSLVFLNCVAAEDRQRDSCIADTTPATSYSLDPGFRTIFSVGVKKRHLVMRSLLRPFGLRNCAPCDHFAIPGNVPAGLASRRCNLVIGRMQSP